MSHIRLHRRDTLPSSNNGQFEWYFEWLHSPDPMHPFTKSKRERETKSKYERKRKTARVQNGG